MKKILLFATMLGAFMGLSAADYTDVLTSGANCFNVTGNSYKDATYTSSETGIVYTAQMAGDNSSIQLRSNNNNSGIVVTKNDNGLELKSITVEFNDATANARVADIYESETAYTAPSNLYESGLTASGSVAKSDPKEFVSENHSKYFGLRSKSGAMYISKITIVWSDPAGASSKESAELSFDQTSFMIYKGEAFTAPKLNNPNELAVTYSSSNPEVATVDAAGAVTVLDATGATTITATSEETDKYKAGKATFTLTVVPVATNFAETYAVGNNNIAYINFPMTVTYVNGINCFVQNAEGTEFSLIYGTTPYKVGDVVPAGWYGKYSLYSKKIHEIVPVGEMPETTSTADVTYKEVTEISEAMISQIVVLKGVTLEEATPSGKSSFTGNIGETTFDFYNSFQVASAEAGTYDITAAVSYYGSKEYVQLYPIEYKVASTDGINGVEVDANAPVQYYNLSGMPISNPAAGQVVIRVQGGKANKIHF